MNALATVDWALVNARVLGVFGRVLIVAGIAGFLIPPRHAQVLAAVGGFFPARAFRYKPADHVLLHLMLGLALAAVRWLALR